MNNSATEMSTSLKKKGLEDEFPLLHHFSSSKFKADPVHLDWFVDYCEGKELAEENNQTISRCLAAAENIKTGSKPQEAIDKAWLSFPILTR